MKQNPYDRILKEKPKKLHLSTMPKFCPKDSIPLSWYLKVISGFLAFFGNQSGHTQIRPYSALSTTITIYNTIVSV